MPVDGDSCNVRQADAPVSGRSAAVACRLDASAENPNADRGHNGQRRNARTRPTATVHKLRCTRSRTRHFIRRSHKNRVHRRDSTQKRLGVTAEERTRRTTLQSNGGRQSEKHNGEPKLRLIRIDALNTNSATSQTITGPSRFVTGRRRQSRNQHRADAGPTQNAEARRST